MTRSLSLIKVVTKSTRNRLVIEMDSTVNFRFGDSIMSVDARAVLIEQFKNCLSSGVEEFDLQGKYLELSN